MKKIAPLLFGLITAIVVEVLGVLAVLIVNSISHGALGEIPVRWLLPRTLIMTLMASVIVVPTLLVLTIVLTTAIRMVGVLLPLRVRYSSEWLWATISTMSALIVAGLGSTVQVSGGDPRFCWIYLADSPGCVIMALLSPYFYLPMVLVSVVAGWFAGRIAQRVGLRGRTIASSGAPEAGAH